VDVILTTRQPEILSGIVEFRGVFKRSPLALPVSLVAPGEDEGSDTEA